MARALQLARRGQYSAMPNPHVGCVLVRDGHIIGEGYTRPAGGNHAEVEALLIDATLGPEITLAQVRRISFMRLMRADSDEAEIVHETDIAGVGTCSLMMRVIRDDV